LDSLSLCQVILTDFYAFFTNQLTGYDFFLNTAVNYTPFMDRFKEDVVGVEAVITITAEQTACIPAHILEQYFLLFQDGSIFTTESGNQILYQQQP
jgi:hypothetical protein